MNEVKLTDHQKEILEKFRINLSDLLTSRDTDVQLLKWLRAKHFDLKKAERSFRQTDLHRKMFNAEKINEIYVKPKILQDYERSCFLGFCKDGTPVRYTSFHMDFYGFVQSLSQFDMYQYVLDFMEGDDKLMREHNMKTGQDHSKIIFICDFDGFTLQDTMSYKCVHELQLDFVRVFQEYYPEKWKYFIVINAPYILYKFFSLIKHILKKTLVEKLQIASKSTTPTLLKELIDEDLIPINLGGKRVKFGVDGQRTDFVNPYGKIPEEYYLRNSMHLIEETDPRVEAVTIRAKCCYNVNLIVKEARSTIRMEFRMENGSIGFTILYRQFGSDPENPDVPASDEYIDPDDESSNVLMSGFKSKVQSHVTPCDGTCTVVWPGIYILQFDNTGSWFGSRKLYYRVTVTPPNT